MGKLTDADRIEIRRMYGQGSYSYDDLAELYHVTKTTIRRVILGQYAPPKGSKKRLHKITTPSNSKKQTKSYKKVTRVSDKDRLRRLTKGGDRQIEAVAEELVSLLDLQLHELADAQVFEQYYKDELHDDAKMRDKLTARRYGEAVYSEGVMVQAPKSKYKELPQAQQGVVDAELREAQYKATMQIVHLANKELEQVRATLNSLQSLAKNVVMYFDNRQVNITVEAKVQASLELLLHEVVYPALEAKLPNVVAVPVAEDMQARFDAKKEMFDKLMEEE